MRIAGFEPAPAAFGPEEGPLLADLVRDPGRAAPFFPYHPADPEAVVRRAARLGEQGLPPSLGPVVDALRAYNRSIGAGPAAEGHLAALARGEAYVVTAGQQPGLLTGPLLTVYKAVTAVSLARRLAPLLGRPVVPVFWTVSDDHDWDEVSTLTVVDRAGEVRRLALPAPAGPRRPFGRIPVPAGALAVVAEAAAAAGGDDSGFYPYTEEVARFLTEAAQASASLAEWFDRVMVRLFRAEGLVIANPLHPALAAACAPFLASAARAAPALTAALATGGERVAARGYPVAFPPGEHSLLFTVRDGARIGLRWDGGAFVSRRGEVCCTPAELAAQAAEDPGSLSPGAALRPALRDSLLPTLCHVAGPGEVSYLAQLGPVYDALGLAMPVVHPRVSLTLVPPEAVAVLRRHGLGWAEAAGGLDDALAAALAREDGVDVEGLFAAAREGITSVHGRLVDRLAAAGIDLSDLAAGNLERVLAQLDYLAAKARQRQRGAHRRLVAEFRRVENLLFPGGQRQDKVLNVTPWLFRVGWGLAGELARAPLAAGHQIAVWSAGQAGEEGPYDGGRPSRPARLRPSP